LEVYDVYTKNGDVVPDSNKLSVLIDWALDGFTVEEGIILNNFVFIAMIFLLLTYVRYDFSLIFSMKIVLPSIN